MELLGGPKESCMEEEEDPLEEKLKSLEQEWSSLKQSSNHHLRRCSTDPKSNVTTLVKEDYFDQLVMNNNVSPRQLMLSLQLQSNSSGRQINDMDMALVEILQDRCKGRRLFEDEDDDLCSQCFNLVTHDKESVSSSSSVLSYGGLGLDFHSSSESSSSVKQRVERQVVEEEREIKVDRKIWLAVIAWLGVPLAMFMLGIISSKCNGDQGHVIVLVPT